MPFNEVIVLGAGAIGSAFGALLSRQNKVRLIARQAHVDAVNQNSLQVFGIIEETFPVKAATKIESIPEKALIVLTTKAVDAADSLAEVKPLLKDDTIILALQNGLGVKEEIKAKTGLAVIAGLTYAEVTFLEPGKILIGGLNKIFMEPSKKSEAVKTLFNQSGLTAETPANFKEKQWEKVVINCVLNPLTAIFEVENFRIAGPRLDQVKKSIIEECVEVAKAEGVELKKDFLAHVNTFFSDSQNKSSMWQDMEKGRKTEIDYLNGRIAKLAKKHGLKALTNEKIALQIKRLEAD